MRAALVLTLLVLLSGCSGNAGAPGSAFFQPISINAALLRAEESERLVMVEFTADNCPWCQRMEQETWADPNVAAWVKDHAVAVQIHAGRERRLASKYGVRGTPEVLFLNPDGKEVARIGGFAAPQAFLEAVSGLR